MEIRTTVSKELAKKIRANVPPQVAKEILAEIKRALVSAHNGGCEVGRYNARQSQLARAELGITEEQAEEWGLFD